jgi:3-oxoacyl-[acyl-carrier-protein] synthase III
MSKAKEVPPTKPCSIRGPDEVVTPPVRHSAYNSMIESIGVYLPPKIVSTREILSARKKTFWLPLERITGIRNRRMAGDDEFSIDLARHAIARCLALSKHDPSNIDLLICCNISRVDGPGFHGTFEPSTSIRLSKEFGFNNALTFDVGNACAGMFTAIKIVDLLLRTGLVSVAMIASGEYITHLTKTAQKEITGYFDPRLACLTLGDAGAAIILERAPCLNIGFHAIDLYTAAQYSDYCIAKPTDQKHGGAIMFTKSAKLHEVAKRHSANHGVEYLKKFNWTKNHIDHIIIHQTSQIGIYEAAKEVNALVRDKLCHEGNMINNLADRGNTATTSHFVAIWDNILNGKIKEGDNIVFAVQASGLTVGTAFYTVDDLPNRVRCAKYDNDTINTIPHKSGTTRKFINTTTQKIRIESFGFVDVANSADRDSIKWAQMAVDQCLENSSYHKDGIEFLIFAGVYRSEFICEPAIAALIAKRAGLNEGGISATGKKTFAFDIFNSSIGFLNACYIGSGMINSRECCSVMIVASEIENNAEIQGAELLGIAEVGSAVILDNSPDNTEGFGNFIFRSFKDYSRALSSWVVQKDGKTGLHIQRTGDLEALYLKCIPQTVEELLSSEGLCMDDIAIILPPQISTGFVSRLAETLKVTRDRFVDIAEDGRDLFSSTLPYTMRYAKQKRRVHRGDIGLIINVGSGIQIGGAIYYF